MKNDKTLTFSVREEREKEIRQTLESVYNSLKEKGYNPINQIVGYILTEEPTYITSHNNARIINEAIGVAFIAASKGEKSAFNIFEVYVRYPSIVPINREIIIPKTTRPNESEVVI